MSVADWNNTPLQVPSDDEGLSADERRYIGAARAPNMLRGYRSDWTEFTAWSAEHDADPLPASSAAITGYLTMLALAGA